MSIIYKPAGKAREYSPLAANIYTGCNHGCKYCYASNIRRMTRNEYLNVIPRRNILNEYEKDCKKFYNSQDQLLFCFMTDPYNKLESELRLTRECLKLSLKYKIPISILTKSKTVLNDIDIIKKFKNHIKVGLTLTFLDKDKSKEWEPEASIPDDRLNVLKQLKENNIETWASFEPVIDPDESLKILEITIKENLVDSYKIGKLNNFKGLDNNIDWTMFLKKSIDLLRENNKKFYVKYDLRKITDIKLYGNEVLCDEFNLDPFE